jgi:hypothetical protein
MILSMFSIYSIDYPLERCILKSGFPQKTVTSLYWEEGVFVDINVFLAVAFLKL